MAKQKRVPDKAINRATDKEVRIRETSKSAKPTWRFSSVDLSGPFAWPKNQPIELEILQKLHSFDSMTWSAIEGKQHHAISVEDLSKEAQKRLKDIQQDDIDEVFTFHFAGKQRIVGIRELGHVRLLWWDPEHGVCPSVLKHT